MFDFYEKRKIRTVLFSKATLVVLMVLIVLLGISVFERFHVAYTVAEKRVMKEQELQELKNRAAELQERVSYLNSDRGREEELRERFDSAKEGEQVVVLVKDDEVIDETEVSKETEPQKASWLDVFIFW